MKRKPVSTRDVNMDETSSRKMTDLFNPKDYMRNGLSERDIYICREVFELMDPKQNGFITPNDLRSGFTSMGIGLNRADLFNLLCDYDQDEVGNLDFNNFLDAVSEGLRPCDQDTQADYKRVFKKLSGNKDILSKDDLLKFMRSVGIQPSEDDLVRMYKKLEVTDENIDFQKFYHAVTEFIYSKKDPVRMNHSQNKLFKESVRGRPESIDDADAKSRGGVTDKSLTQMEYLSGRSIGNSK